MHQTTSVNSLTTGVSTQCNGGHLFTSSTLRHRVIKAQGSVPGSHKYRINGFSICAIAFLFCAMCRPHGHLHCSSCPVRGGYTKRALQQLSRFSFDALPSESESFPSNQLFGKDSTGLCLYGCAGDYFKRIFLCAPRGKQVRLHFTCFVLLLELGEISL